MESKKLSDTGKLLKFCIKRVIEAPSFWLASFESSNAVIVKVQTIFSQLIKAMLRAIDHVDILHGSKQSGMIVLTPLHAFKLI